MLRPASPRWPSASRGRIRRCGWAALALLLHVAVIGGCIWLVHPSVPSAPTQEQAVELVFATPAPTQPPATETPETPAATEAEPPAPEPQQAEATPVPEPEPPPAPPPQQQAEAVPPEQPQQQADAMPAEQPPVVPAPPPPHAERKTAPVKPAPVVRHAPPRPMHTAKPTPSRAAAEREAVAVPQATTPAPANDPSVLVAWERSVSAWLATHRVYPYEARRRGEEGSVLLRFTADRDGRVSDIALVRSAGSAVLDNAAQATVRDATLPPFSPGMSQQKITVTVQIRYALRN